MRQRARTDLCGGRSAMAVPTATLPHKTISTRSMFSESAAPPFSTWSAMCTPISPFRRTSAGFRHAAPGSIADLVEG
jgi:hypothetical protein